jgi:hypothetical protein
VGKHTNFNRAAGYRGIIRELKRHNIPYTVIRGSKHFKIEFTCNGQRIVKPFSISGGSFRLERNAISDIRNSIRIAQTQKVDKNVKEYPNHGNSDKQQKPDNSGSA